MQRGAEGSHDMSVSMLALGICSLCDEGISEAFPLLENKDSLNHINELADFKAITKKAMLIHQKRQSADFARIGVGSNLKVGKR